MTDFTAIGEYVAEAKKLLDNIKGGAIRTMQTAFDAFMVTVNSEWTAKKAQVDSEALAAIGRIDNNTIRTEIGWLAQNYNADFMDTQEIAANEHGVKNVYPLSVGLKSGLNDCFRIEMLPVQSGDAPLSRTPEAKELLDYMGIGRDAQHFAGSFKIMKMTVLKSVSTSGPHIFFSDNVLRAPAATFMAYARVSGTADVTPLGGDTAGQWKQITVQQSSDNPGSNSTITLTFSGASVGDVVYIALPTVVAGHYPQSKKHGVLYNLKTDLTRQING